MVRIRHETNRGVAASILTGLRHASTEIVCSIDCDCSYDPHDLANMIPLLRDGVALVTASPYHPKGHVHNVPAWRLLLSKSLSRMYRIVLRQPLHTYTSCFRVYRRSAMIGIQPERGGFLGIAELIGKLALSGAEIVEHPATLEVRVLGHSKMKIVQTIVGHLGLITSLAWQRRGAQRAHAVPVIDRALRVTLHRHADRASGWVTGGAVMPSVGIVGGGMLGMTLAWRLRQRGFAVHRHRRGADERRPNESAIDRRLHVGSVLSRDAAVRPQPARTARGDRAGSPAALGNDAHRLLRRWNLYSLLVESRLPAVSAAVAHRQGAPRRDDSAGVANQGLATPGGHPGQPTGSAAGRDAARSIASGCRCSRASSVTTTGWRARRSSGRSSRACTRPVARDSSANRSATSRAATTRCSGGSRSGSRRAASRSRAVRRSSQVPNTHDGADVTLADGTARRFDRVVVTIPCPRVAALCPQLTEAERARLRPRGLSGHRVCVAPDEAAAGRLLRHQHHGPLGAVHRRDRDDRAGRSRAIRRQHARLPAALPRSG